MEQIKKYYKYIILIVTIILFIIFSFIFFYNENKENVKLEKEVVVKKTAEKIDKEIKKYIYIDLKGAVNNPNVYKIEEGSRIIDLINQAGGFTENADTSILNLSKILKDEMCIIIYTKEEVEEYKRELLKVKEINQKLEEKIVSIDDFNDAEIKDGNNDIITKSNTNIVDTNKTESSKISINTATKDELLKINGIGNSKAEAIIKYREENGPFNVIEDIKNVSGIGESLFEKIKEYIEV